MTNNTTDIIFNVPEQHPCYAGHFPGNPLVPGALLLKWILPLIEEKYNCRITLLKQIKFLHIVKPGDQLCIKAENKKDQLSIEVFANSVLAMKGSISALSPTDSGHQHD